MIELSVPFSREEAAKLRAGDRVLLSGVIYTARDAAHKRLVAALENGEEPPFELEGAVVYYVGPTPAPPGRVIGSAGPTTSCRMDAYAPALLERGLLGMIGKGGRSQKVVESMIKNGAVYFAATGGAAALIGRSVAGSEVIAYEDLGAEAVRRLVVRDLPVIVAIDSTGGNLYETGRREYLASVGCP